MPKLWDETIEEHRRSVRQATLDTTAALVAERGLRAVTMSEIAEKTGIGRATLYKYFPDVETILAAWHQRQITRHLAHLTEVRDRAGTPADRLEAVLTAYAHIQRERVRHHRDQPHGRELAVLLHGDHQVEDSQRELHAMVRDLVEEAAAGLELSATTSRPTNSPPTASTPSTQPVTHHPRRRSPGWSLSPWPEYDPNPEAPKS